MKIRKVQNERNIEKTNAVLPDPRQQDSNGQKSVKNNNVTPDRFPMYTIYLTLLTFPDF